MKKIFDFAILVVAILAVIGGTAFLFHDRHALFGVANICLAAMAFPFIRDIIKDLLGK